MSAPLPSERCFVAADVFATESKARSARFADAR